MMAKPFATLTLLLSVSLIAFAEEPKGDAKPDARDLVAMQGVWLPESAELAGQKYPDEVLKLIRLEIKDDKYTATVAQNIDKGTFKTDATAKPKKMDIIGGDGPNKGKTFPCIYEIDGDTMRVCYDLSMKAYPTEFKTGKGTVLYLVVYKREKK